MIGAQSVNSEHLGDCRHTTDTNETADGNSHQYLNQRQPLLVLIYRT
jgi:hypothetical protein